MLTSADGKMRNIIAGRAEYLSSLHLGTDTLLLRRPDQGHRTTDRIIDCHLTTLNPLKCVLCGELRLRRNFSATVKLRVFMLKWCDGNGI